MRFFLLTLLSLIVLGSFPPQPSSSTGRPWRTRPMRCSRGIGPQDRQSSEVRRAERMR